MPAMLLAYDAAGAVIATLDYLVARDEDGQAFGLLDFEEHERVGGQLTDIWSVDGAAGSGTWPEYIGARAHDFKVELAGKRITALVHARSGARRERATIEAAIAAVPVVDGARDIRAIVGGPQRPIQLDANGNVHPVVARGTPAHLPVLGLRAAR
jgi:hypothetical protein